MKLPVSQSIPITIMTFNIENGGTQIDFNKIVAAIQQSNADVVGIQEAWGNIDKLAHALHWKYFSRAQHIVSKYPLFEIDEAHNDHHHHEFVFIELMPKQFVAFANLHLPDQDYGPELINDAKAQIKMKNVIAREEKTRLRFALPIIKKLAAFAKSGTPVFVTGDFNSASHLDWQTKSHHRSKVDWPVTKTFAAFGFKDSYRTIHADANLHPGITWPAMRPIIEMSVDGFNPSANDLPDRIDFIFTGGPSEILSSKVVGENEISPWPSDHRAVVSTFHVWPKPLPSSLQIKNIELTTSSLPVNANISVAKTNVKVGEPVTISWQNAPGYRFDYIRINKTGSDKLAWGEAIRMYTHAKTNGSIILNAKSAKGNWLAWHVGEEGRWPLAIGDYDVKLMLDDGNQVLAATTIKVTK